MDGLRWLKRHPRYLFVLLVPSLIGLFSLFVILGVFFVRFNTILSWILFDKPDAFLLLLLYWVLYLLLAIILFLLSFIPPLLVTNIVASPFYEMVSCAIEKDMRGGEVATISWAKVIKMLGEEAKKVAFIFFVTILIMFIPGINVLAIFIPAFLLGWDFCDYPLARRGWSFKKRLHFGLKNFWATTGLGLWLIIPALQFIVAPVAAAGGTIITIKALTHESSKENEK